MILIVGGMAVYVRAWIGMRALEGGARPATGQPFAAMTAYDSYWRLSRNALVIIGVGLAVAVVGSAVQWWTTKKRARA
jgi:hypothetical protein